MSIIKGDKISFNIISLIFNENTYILLFYLIFHWL